jgi:hypothetical protein
MAIPTPMCVVIADAARARLFTFRAPGSARRDLLVEAEDLVHPERRRRQSEVLTESRPGLRQSQRGGPRHGVDDHRAARRDAGDRLFAGDIVERVRALSERLGRCDVAIVASRPMLGQLRAALERAPAWLGRRSVRQLGGDLTRLRPAGVHDWLAAEGVLPARRRRALER